MTKGMIGLPKGKVVSIDIDEPAIESQGIAYYRLDTQFKDFLSLCNKKHGILGFEFEDGSYNFGVILRNGKKNEIQIFEKRDSWTLE